VITGTLADKLGVGVGDSARVKTSLRSQWIDVRIAAISKETLGAPIFANLDVGRRLTGLAGRFNTLYVNTSAAAAPAVKHRLGDMSGALSVLVKAETLARFTEMMGFMDFYQGLLLGFGLAMAFVVVYNTLNANVTERTREIGTMRTIGEGAGRIAWMVTIENLLLGLAAAPLGAEDGGPALRSTLLGSVHPHCIHQAVLGRGDPRLAGRRDAPVRDPTRPPHPPAQPRRSHQGHGVGAGRYRTTIRSAQGFPRSCSRHWQTPAVLT
jgi:hypothetical protein